MNPSNIQRFICNGIEAVSATIQVPNASYMQIAVVYRSPSVTQATLITVMSRLLTHVSLHNTPCVIVGDFKEDILHHPNSAIIRLMSSFGFTQLVQITTTPQGTLIDHVYYNNLYPSHYSLQDTYYTDHDTVYISFPCTDS